MKTPFNLNGHVWVKLTPEGLKILENTRQWMQQSFPNLPKFAPPPTDEDGYTQYQLWSLMNDSGQYMLMGSKIPFETDVFFETKEN